MWENYSTGNGEEGSISITYGHSKQKNMIKIGLGVANGVAVTGDILDDKVYNNENSDKFKELVGNFDLNIEEMYNII